MVQYYSSWAQKAIMKIKNKNISYSDFTKILSDAILLTKSWACQIDIDIVRDVLKKCKGIHKLDILNGSPDEKFVCEQNVFYLVNLDEKHYKYIGQIKPKSEEQDKVGLEYEKQKQKVLEEIKTKPEYLREDLAKYSPKYQEIIKKINKSQGPVLVYSQFRFVEGLQLFSMAMDAQHFSELKVIKKGHSYQLNIEKNDKKTAK